MIINKKFNLFVYSEPFSTAPTTLTHEEVGHILTDENRIECVSDLIPILRGFPFELILLRMPLSAINGETIVL